MTPDCLVAAVLAIAVVAGWVRLLLWQRRGPVRRWRVALLLAAQPVLAALLWLTLFPPARTGTAGTLVIATAGAPRLSTLAAGDRLVALPEARTGAERAPDLGTALRRFPGTRAVRIIGGGLEARDLDAARGVSVRFDPPTLPLGLIRLDPPAPVAPGGAFRVGAQARGMAGGTAELLDPAGRVVDAVRLTATGDVTLTGTARGAGTSLFALRLRDTGRQTVETAAVPVWTVTLPTTRLSILAGAPGPEVKYLRRWAADAGLAVTVRTSLGGGIALGDGPPPNPATLARTDMLVIDDRAWAALSAGERGAVTAAVRAGMGLLLRVTGPLPDPVRRSWQAFGFALPGGQATAAVTLPRGAPDDDALSARRGPGTRDNPASIAGGRDDLPALTRRAIAIGGRGVVAAARDADGTVLAGWRAVGLGRAGVSTVEDSFALVTAGQGDRHAEWWSDLIGTLARAQPGAPAAIEPLGQTGRRLTICDLPPNLAASASVLAPGGRTIRLLPDPTTGAPPCAGFWPAAAGWHVLATGATRTPFYVYPADALPAVRAAERRAATLLLVGTRPMPAGAATPAVPGSPWPWFAGWLVLAAACWWLERSRLGRPAERWLGKSGQAAKWSFCLKVASMAAEQETR